MDFLTFRVGSSSSILEGEVSCTVDEGLKSEEQNRDASSKDDSSSDIGAELVVVRDPNQYLFLELDRVLVAALGDVKVR